MEQPDRINDHGNVRITARLPWFWQTRTGVYLLIAFIFVGLLLGHENREIVRSSDWVIWLPLVICVGLHTVLRRGHGSDGKRS